MPESPITQREAERLERALEKLTNSIEQLPAQMEATYVRKDVLEPQLSDIRSDIAAHSEWLLWAQRLVIGAVIVALLTLVIVQRSQ